MAQIRVPEAAVFLGVSDDTMRRWISRGELTARHDDAGRAVVDGAELAEFARARAAAQPVPSSPSSSARNQFPGLVTRVLSDEVMSQVEMQCGPYRVVSLMSTEAVRELGLAPGSVASATIKATNVIVTPPADRG